MLQQFVPNLFVSSIYEIDLPALQSAGIKGIITDLDNTLVAWSDKLATPEVVQWLDDVRDNYGMRVTIVSNNKEARVSEFAGPLSVRYISNARKPTGEAFDLAMQWMGTSLEQTAVIGDQLFTDIWGGNRRRLYTILVVPIHDREWFGTKVLRLMEKGMFSLLRTRGWMER
ncbi:MAG: family hydrolase [Bacilli bacterium]|nr:family hydrolase [Bacilli bacterium]